MFHHFHDGKSHPRAQGSLSAEDLDRLILFIRPDRILDPEEWVDRTEKGTLDPASVCMTFDDNLRCQYDIALPVLKAHDLRAFWFVYTSPLEGVLERLEIYRAFRNRFAAIDEFYRAFKEALAPDELEALRRFDERSYLSEFPFYEKSDREFRFLRDEVLGRTRYISVMDELLTRYGFDEERAARDLWMDGACLKRLAESGHVVGLHSHTHPTKLACLSLGDQYDEYSKNLEALKRVTGVAPKAMAHPSNSYNGDTLKILRSLGLSVGFRADMREMARASAYELPREDQANLMRLVA